MNTLVLVPGLPKKIATCKSKCSACGGQRCLDSGQGTHVAKLKTGRKLGAGDPQSTDRGGGWCLVHSSLCNRQRLTQDPARRRFGRDKPDNRGDKKTNNDARLNCLDDMHRLPLSQPIQRSPYSRRK